MLYIFPQLCLELEWLSLTSSDPEDYETARRESRLNSSSEFRTCAVLLLYVDACHNLGHNAKGRAPSPVVVAAVGGREPQNTRVVHYSQVRRKGIPIFLVQYFKQRELKRE